MSQASDLIKPLRPAIAHLRPDDRERLLRIALRRARRDWRWRIAWIFTAVLSIGVFFAWDNVAHAFPLFSGRTPVFVFIVAGFFVYFHYYSSFQSRALRRALQAELSARNIRPLYCVICEYDLRETPDRCPECGAIYVDKKHRHG